jgi:hypothetical protein
LNQPKTQSYAYWADEFSIADSDIEQLYNHFLEVERPQTVDQIAQVIISHRVAEERSRIKKLLTGRTVYQPKDSHKIGEELVFPALRYTHGEVKSAREGYDPRYGHYTVIDVEIEGKDREFASDLPGVHQLNIENGESYDAFAGVDLEELNESFGSIVAERLTEALASRLEFVRLSELWFVRDLMADVNIGHLHLAEAVLEVNEGGPLTTEEIMVHLEMDTGVDPEVQLFSLNYGLTQDERFDEIGPPGKVAWFLQRLEPEGVLVVPERLRYTAISYDRAVLSPQLLLLERELDDEWSDLEVMPAAQPTILSLSYPHRWAGTLPLSSRTRPLFPVGNSPRQRIILLDEQAKKEISAWIVQEERYIYGLAEWYEEHQIPVGGFITLKPGPEPGVILLDYDRRRPQREWVRLATVANNQISFELERRSVACGYDDLLLVGTDYVTAVDVLARRYEADQTSLVSLIMMVFPSLAKLNPQETVHTKTIYSAVNMVRRVPPGPLFADLIKHPAFRPVGDHYSYFDRSRSR